MIKGGYMWYQLFGIFVVVASSIAMIDRYGVPSVGMSLVYLLFGIVFVVFGVMVGQMQDTDLLSLLLLQEWGINLSLMGIGYAAIVAGVVGLLAPAYKLFKTASK